MIYTKVFRTLLLVGLTTSLTGCVSNLLPEPAPAPKIYRFKAAASPVSPSAQAFLLRVDRPAVSKSLQGQNIVISPDGQRLAVVEQAKWAEPLPTMIQSSLLDVMSGREELIGVLPTSGARTDYRIHLTVRHFEAEFDRGEGLAPLVVIDYAATLSDATSRQLLGSKNFKETLRASDYSVSAIVRAQENANKGVMNNIADWIESVLKNKPS